MNRIEEVDIASTLPSVGMDDLQAMGEAVRDHVFEVLPVRLAAMVRPLVDEMVRATYGALVQEARQLREEVAELRGMVQNFPHFFEQMVGKLNVKVEMPPVPFTVESPVVVNVDVPEQQIPMVQCVIPPRKVKKYIHTDNYGQPRMIEEVEEESVSQMPTYQQPQSDLVVGTKLELEGDME